MFYRYCLMELLRGILKKNNNCKIPVVVLDMLDVALSIKKEF